MPNLLQTKGSDWSDFTTIYNSFSGHKIGLYHIWSFLYAFLIKKNIDSNAFMMDLQAIMRFQLDIMNNVYLLYG